MNLMARLAPEDGRVAAFVVAMTAGILLLAGLVLDGGLALAAKIRAIGEAQEAARAGAQQIDLAAYRADGTLRVLAGPARTAATRYLAASAHHSHHTVTVTGNTVTVTIIASQDAQLLGLAGIDTLTVEGTGAAQPLRDVTGAGP